jgi:hypothetical protein
MARTNQPDLFGNAEADLFGEERPQAYVPEPEHVRNRLRALLTDMRGSAVWPWDSSMVTLHRERTFDYLLGLLPAAEAASWRDQIETEIMRLDATVVAAE